MGNLVEVSGLVVGSTSMPSSIRPYVFESIETLSNCDVKAKIAFISTCMGP
jgi:hypothetical protein